MMQFEEFRKTNYQESIDCVCIRCGNKLKYTWDYNGIRCYYACTNCRVITFFKYNII